MEEILKFCNLFSHSKCTYRVTNYSYRASFYLEGPVKGSISKGIVSSTPSSVINSLCDPEQVILNPLALSFSSVK